MRLLACLIVAPQRGYDEPAILSYAISSFCPTSADGLHHRKSDLGIPVREKSAKVVLVNPLAISCPGERRAGDARSHLFWPRLIRKEHKDIASTSPAPRPLDLLFTVHVTLRCQQLFGPGWLAQHVAQGDPVGVPR